MKALAVKNGLWNALANVAGTLSGIVGSILIVRSLTPEAYGTFSYYVWLASMMGVLGTLAFPNAVTKITSELRGNGRDAEAEALSRWVALGLLSINLLLSIVIIIWTFRRSAPEHVYWQLISLSMVPNAIAAVLRSTLWGREHYRPVSITLMVSSFLQLIMIVVVSQLGWGGPGYVGALLATNFIQATGLGLAFRGSSRVAEQSTSTYVLIPKHSVIRRYVAFAVPATIVLLYEVVVWQRSAIFFLERLSSLEQVGYYNLAYTAFGVLLVLGWALVNGFYPAISRDYGARKWSQIQEKMRQGLIMATLFAVPLSFGAWATFDRLIALLYTDKMLPAVPVAQVLMLGLFPGVITGMYSLMVNAVGGIWLQVRLGVLLAATNIALNILIIPRLGALGGAIANTSTQLLYTALLVVIVWRLYKISLPWRTMCSIIGIGVITTFLMPELLKGWVSNIPGLIVTIILAGCTYMTAIWGLGYLRVLRTVEEVA